MHWKIKGLIQGALSILPGGITCNHLLQRNLGQMRSESYERDIFLNDVTVLLLRLAQFGLDPERSRILEIGTGWMPVFPISLALAGFRNIVTVDLMPHLRKSAVKRTLLSLETYLQHPCLLAFSTYEQIRARYERFIRATHPLEAMGITYRAPYDAANTDWPVESFDVVTSNNVFEHVPSPILLDILAEGKRLLRPGGHILHCVNCGDHYAYSDPNINLLNYLQFSSEEWSRWNNSIQYQNRLRPVDFVEMAEDRRFRIESVEVSCDANKLEQLQNIIVAPEFRHYSPEQLASTSVTLIASA
jgi:SAM-dependent methyltransferase